MKAVAISLVGIGAIAALRSSKARAAIGVPIVPYVTDAHRKAMEVLARPLLSVTAASGTATTQARDRYNAIANGMIALRGFHVVGLKALTLWTAADAYEIASRFIDAAKAGVAVEHRIEEGGAGYRLTNLRGFEALPILGRDVNELVLEDLLAGKRPSDVPLTDLGEAVLAAVKLRQQVSWLPQSVTMADSMQAAFNRAVGGLAIEMDACGYLETGKPPPEPTVGEGMAVAAHAVGKFTTGIAGSVAGGIATALVDSPLFWAAGLALVAWKVL